MIDKIRRLLQEALPEAIGALIAAVVIAVVSYLFESTQIALTITITTIWLGCFYVAFKRDKPQIVYTTHLPSSKNKKTRIKGLWRYPRLRALGLVGVVIIPILTASVWSYRAYLNALPPDKIIVLIADFEGPAPQEYRVAETLKENIALAFKEYSDVKVELVRQPFTTQYDARSIGKKRKAALVLWGWYGVTEEKVQMSVHLEVLCELRCQIDFGPETEGGIRTLPRSELQSYVLQNNLSSELTYLSLLVVGLARSSAQDWSEAITKFNKAVEFTEAPLNPSQRSLAYFLRGFGYAAQGDIEQAIVDLDEAIRLDPNNALYYQNRAIMQLRNRPDKTFEDLNHALEIEPDNVVALINLGQAYLVTGNSSSAVASFNRAIEVDPENPTPYMYRGFVYFITGYYDLALQDHNHAIRLDPKNGQAYIYRGDVYFLGKSNYRKAIDDYSQAAQLTDDSDSLRSQAYHKIGRSYTRLGNTSRALEYYNRAIELRPRYPQALLRRGKIYYQIGLEARAILDFRQVLEMSGDPELRDIYEVYPTLKSDAEEYLRELGATE